MSGPPRPQPEPLPDPTEPEPQPEPPGPPGEPFPGPGEPLPPGPTVGSLSAPGLRHSDPPRRGVHVHAIPLGDGPDAGTTSACSCW